MDNINDCFLYAGFLANKNQSGEISPEDFNLCAPVAQLLHLRVKLGLPEVYTVEKREAPQEFQTTQNNSDALRRFIVPKSLVKSGIGFDFPTDFVAFANGQYLFVEQLNGQNVSTPQPIEIVTAGERGIRLNNYIKAPSYEYPIGSYTGNQIIIDPDGVNQLSLIYIREPVKPIRNYTVVNDFNIYNPVGSVDFEFPKIEWEQIVNRLVKYWAINIREQELYNAVDKAVKTGE